MNTGVIVLGGAALLLLLVQDQGNPAAPSEAPLLPPDPVTPPVAPDAEIFPKPPSDSKAIQDQWDLQWTRPWEGQPLAPLAVGSRRDPEIATLLDQLDAYLRDAGVNVEIFSAPEVTLQRAWGLHAIPDRSLWPNLVELYFRAFEPLRTAIGRPLSAKVYRSPKYNRDVVKGKPRSLHQWASAVDLVDPSGSNDELARAAADLFSRGGPFGLGIYGASSPSHIHIDYGGRRRTWASTRSWLT